MKKASQAPCARFVVTYLQGAKFDKPSTQVLGFSFLVEWFERRSEITFAPRPLAQRTTLWPAVLRDIARCALQDLPPPALELITGCCLYFVQTWEVQD